MTLMTNNNDSDVCDDDFGTDGDGVRHCPPLPMISRPPALLEEGARVGSEYDG